MDEETAARIYDNVLVPICGAAAVMRGHFIILQMEGCREFRFGGKLGFGGKFWTTNDKFRVDYYQEDEDPEKQRITKEANGMLAAIKKEVTDE